MFSNGRQYLLYEENYRRSAAVRAGLGCDLPPELGHIPERPRSALLQAMTQSPRAPARRRALNGAARRCLFREETTARRYEAGTRDWACAGMRIEPPAGDNLPSITQYGKGFRYIERA
jgi:hypothetical protein